MDLKCPKCHSDNTQKITAIVDSGTTHSRGVTTNVGVGSVGGRMAVGSSTGTTNTTHKTALAQKFPVPSKRSEQYRTQLVLGTLILGGIAYAILNAVAGMFLGSILGIGAFWWIRNMLNKSMKEKATANKHYNENIYPREIKTWEQGFYCHRCEHVFVPE